MATDSFSLCSDLHVDLCWCWCLPWLTRHESHLCVSSFIGMKSVDSSEWDLFFLVASNRAFFFSLQSVFFILAELYKLYFLRRIFFEHQCFHIEYIRKYFPQFLSSFPTWIVPHRICFRNWDETRTHRTVYGHFGICRYVSSLVYFNPLKSLILAYFNRLKSLILANFNTLKSLIPQDLY